MITLAALAELADRYPEALRHPVAPLRIGDREWQDEPVLMGTVNLSRDSTYRESIATGTRSAVRKARLAVAEGAALVDIGAESTTAKASRVTGDEQRQRLLPVIEQCVDEGIVISLETYDPAVAAVGLAAGATVLNLTGAADQENMFDLAAEFGATVIICYVAGRTVRDITDVRLDKDPLPGLLAHFARRVEIARAHGVERIVIDPGMGFYYGNLVDPITRVRHQTEVILNTFRLRELGLPICHALPHAFDLFEEHFRSAEGFFAVLAVLGGAQLLRTHEVPLARAVTGAMQRLDVSGGWDA
ncbi:MAG: dihydropteroate synthase [Candidatus Nanopelagicales bacterium]